jgi:hypothetical protein
MHVRGQTTSDTGVAARAATTVEVGHGQILTPFSMKQGNEHGRMLTNGVASAMEGMRAKKIENEERARAKSILDEDKFPQMREPFYTPRRVSRAPCHPSAPCRE